MQDVVQQVQSQVRSAWRFRWHGAALAWAVGLVGWVFTAAQPDIYEARARVFVDTTSVLRPLLNNSIVPPDVSTRLQYVRQALLGRDYLERVALDASLDAAAATPAARDAVLRRLAETILIDAAPAGREGPTRENMIFTISFRHERPETAEVVVRSLLNLLIEDTLGANREGTDTAERFLDERIREYENRLQRAEQALADFQRQNSGRLPGSEGGYFERMQRETEQIEATKRQLRLAESRLERLRQQLDSESPVLLSDTEFDREPPPNSLDARIRDHRANLDRMLLDYTERHPDVAATREALVRLEELRTEQLRSLGVENPDQQISTLGSNPVYQAVQIASNEVEVEIATLRADLREREERLAELQGLIAEVPEVEAELAKLNRDYKVIYDQYQLLIQSRETQSLSRKASDTDQVEFRVIDPPLASPGPVAPPRLLLLAGVLGAAFAACCGLCYVLSQFKPVFCTARALRDSTGLPVLGSVRRIAIKPGERLRARLGLLSFTAAMAGLVVVFAVLVLLEVTGPGLRSLLNGA